MITNNYEKLSILYLSKMKFVHDNKFILAESIISIYFKNLFENFDSFLNFHFKKKVNREFFKKHK